MKKIVLAVFAAATMAAPAFAMSDAACKAEWDKADANRDGVLAGAEARPYLSNMTSAPADGRITPALFMSSCQADTFKTAGTTGHTATTTGQPAGTTGQSVTTTGQTTGTSVVPSPAPAATLPAAPTATGTATTGMSATTTQTATVDPGAPLPGANSFTEEQAKDRVAKAGFASVSAMKKDDQGIWRGTAQKSGATVNVAVDYRGNVVTQ